MRSMLLAYDAEGNVVATLDYMVARNEAGDVVGMVDFEAHEIAGGELTDIWHNDAAAGSGTWPEWIGGRAHDFRVELEPGWSRSKPRGRRPDHRIRALVHRASDHRRERVAVEVKVEPGADIRDMIGAPDRPLQLDDEGRTIAMAGRFAGFPPGATD